MIWRYVKKNCSYWLLTLVWRYLLVAVHVKSHKHISILEYRLALCKQRVEQAWQTVAWHFWFCSKRWNFSSGSIKTPTSLLIRTIYTMLRVNFFVIFHGKVPIMYHTPQKTGHFISKQKGVFVHFLFLGKTNYSIFSPLN